MAYASIQELHEDFRAKAQVIFDQFPYDEEVLRKNQAMNAPLAALKEEHDAAIAAFKVEQAARNEAGRAALAARNAE